jgi:hypothetical protein
MFSSLPRVAAARAVRGLESSSIYRYSFSKKNVGPFHKNNKKIVYGKAPRSLPPSYNGRWKAPPANTKVWGRRMEGSGGRSERRSFHEIIGYEGLKSCKAEVKSYDISRVGPDNSQMADWELLSENGKSTFKDYEYYLFRGPLEAFQTSGSEQIGAGVLATEMAKVLILMCGKPLGEILTCDGNRSGFTHLANKKRPDIFIYCRPDEFANAPSESRAPILCVAEAKSIDTGKGDLPNLAICQLEESLEAGWPIHLPEDSEIPAYTVVGSFLQIGYLRKEGKRVKFCPCGDPIDSSKKSNAGKVAHALWRVKCGMEYLYYEKCIRNQVSDAAMCSLEGRVARVEELYTGGGSSITTAVQLD